MSEDRKTQTRDFSKYDTMSTEALEEVLRRDLDAPSDMEMDAEELLYISEVLAHRNRQSGNTGRTAQEAFESFMKDYFPCEDVPKAEAPKHGIRFAPVVRRLAAAAAAVILVLCIPITASALTWRDIWNVVATWARETFSFTTTENPQISEPTPVDDREYRSLQEMLIQNKIDNVSLPNTIPDRYVLKNVVKDITPMQEIYYATYVDGADEFRILVQSYAGISSERIEINENPIKKYEISGIEYYIFSNMEQIQVAWIQNSFECNISGDLSVEEAEAMIESIGKG